MAPGRRGAGRPPPPRADLDLENEPENLTQQRDFRIGVGGQLGGPFCAGPARGGGPLAPRGDLAIKNKPNKLMQQHDRSIRVTGSTGWPVLARIGAGWADPPREDEPEN